MFYIAIGCPPATTSWGVENSVGTLITVDFDAMSLILLGCVAVRTVGSPGEVKNLVEKFHNLLCLTHSEWVNA